MAFHLTTYDDPKLINDLNCLSLEDTIFIFYKPSRDDEKLNAAIAKRNFYPRVMFVPVIQKSENSLRDALITYLGYLIRILRARHCKFYIVGEREKYIDVASFWENADEQFVAIIQDLSDLS